MAIFTSPIVGDTLKVGYRFQRYWDLSMAIAFFFCELGAGLFLVSMYLDLKLGMIVGLVSAGIFKPYFHLAHMGVPLKSWRAALRPDRSWISRGLAGLVFFLGGGFFYLIDAQFGFFANYFGEGLGGVLGSMAAAAAILGGLVAMTYQGFAMAHSSSFALWNTGLMPVSSFAYGTTCGVFGSLVLGWSGFDPAVRGVLADGAMLALLVNTAIVLGLLHGAYNGTVGGRRSVELLIKTMYAKYFNGLTLLVGLVVPLLVMWIARDTFIGVLFSAVAMSAGFFAFRVLIFKAALYEPIISMTPRTATL
jgi:formate-dependent nitrite reductase membrane component NrfD